MMVGKDLKPGTIAQVTIDVLEGIE